MSLSNQDALTAMREEAALRGYSATVVDSHFTGEASDIGRAIVEKLQDVLEKILQVNERLAPLGTQDLNPF